MSMRSTQSVVVTIIVKRTRLMHIFTRIGDLDSLTLTNDKLDDLNIVKATCKPAVCSGQLSPLLLAEREMSNKNLPSVGCEIKAE